MPNATKAKNHWVRTIWRNAGFGMWVLCGLDAVILVSAWLRFAWIQADAFSGEWPTFSRVLADGPFFHTHLLAGLAGLGLFAGGAAIMVMMRERAQLAATGQDWGFKRKALLAGFAACLGVVHYFHITLTLTRNHDSHMLMSYTFFFGMSGVILGDLWLSTRMRRLCQFSEELLLSALQRRVGFSILWIGIFFFATYVAKDMNSNPWALLTQRLFVLAELTWIIAAHLYAALYVRQIGDHFRRKSPPPDAPEAAAESHASTNGTSCVSPPVHAGLTGF
jgi:hypothetical protein